MPRTFIAFDIDPSNQHYLASLKDRLNWGKASIKWVRAEHIHLTMKFLGDISQNQVESVKEFLSGHFINFKTVNTTIDQLGAFPQTNRPTVLWAGLTGGDELRNIVKHLEDGMFQLGFPKEEKKFAAHITIGRIRTSHKSDRLNETLQSFHFAPPLQQVLKTITFYQSTLTPQGPVYAPLIKVGLAPSPR